MEAIFGEHGLDVWLAAFLWTVAGIAIVKAYYYDRRLNASFKWSYWWNDNGQNVIIGLLACLVGLRMGDALIHFLENKGYEIPVDTDDFVVVLLVFAMLLQNWLHKRKKPLDPKTEKLMRIDNELVAKVDQNEG